MISFQQFRPYYLNPDVVLDFKLRPNLRKSEAVNKKEMLLGELLEKINAVKNDFTFNNERGFLDIKIGNDLFAFEFPPHSEIIDRILAARRDDIDYWIFNCMWLYVENDYVLDDAHEFYSFFLCKGDDIVDAYLSLSHAPLHELPDNILVEKEGRSGLGNFTANDRENVPAMIRLLYEKWFKETVPGKIYIMKKKMEKRLELAHESGIIMPLDDPLPDINISMLKEIISLRKSMKSIRVLLVILVAIAAYLAFIR